eukprot:TRINITY_DN13699_c0_g2_i1.p3 TRINITY_DN13699_c0_g2~~TRINITY_DN13699_c0_g2_i1.p3  ORF type:complete len:135 (-),score=3.93 TRINITY_DN13699_c0_g2_i1:2-406(-)
MKRRSSIPGMKKIVVQRPLETRINVSGHFVINRSWLFRPTIITHIPTNTIQKKNTQRAPRKESHDADSKQWRVSSNSLAFTRIPTIFESPHNDRIQIQYLRAIEKQIDLQELNEKVNHCEDRVCFRVFEHVIDD